MFSTFFLICASATVRAQTQLGADIDGESAEDDSGWSVSLSSDGNRLAIGATGNDGNGNLSGHVRVYEWSGKSWTQLGSDIDGEAAGDEIGLTVSLSSDGNRLAIGAPYNNANSGHVRVFEWSNSTWTQLGTDIDAEAAADYSGFSVSLSSDGNRLANGAIWGNYTRVYQWSGTAWEQLGADIDGEQAGDQSGRSVSLSDDGNRLAVGAPLNDGSGSESGHTRVYQWSGSAWTQLGTDIDGEAAGDRSGWSVSMSSDGNRLAIGALWNGSSAGHARVYQWSGMAWTQLGVDIDGEAAEDYSGEVSLSSDGNRLAIGASGNDGNGDHSGHARVFDLSMFNVFKINPGMNDAWYNPATDGQGFLITVLPSIQQMFLAWFTFDIERPPENVEAILGDPGHRWLTAFGPYTGSTASLTVELTEGGVFDADDPPAINDGIGDGVITIEFADCTEGLLTYELTSPNVSGEIPIERIADDNVALCETLSSQ